MTKIKVTLTTEDGEVLDQFIVREDPDQGSQTVVQLANSVRDAVGDQCYVEED